MKAFLFLNNLCNENWHFHFFVIANILLAICYVSNAPIGCLFPNSVCEKALPLQSCALSTQTHNHTWTLSICWTQNWSQRRKLIGRMQKVGPFLTLVKSCWVKASQHSRLLWRAECLLPAWKCDLYPSHSHTFECTWADIQILWHTNNTDRHFLSFLPQTCLCNLSPW